MKERITDEKHFFLIFETNYLLSRSFQTEKSIRFVSSFGPLVNKLYLSLRKRKQSNQISSEFPVQLHCWDFFSASHFSSIKLSSVRVHAEMNLITSNLMTRLTEKQVSNDRDRDREKSLPCSIAIRPLGSIGRCCPNRISFSRLSHRIRNNVRPTRSRRPRSNARPPKKRRDPIESFPFLTRKGERRKKIEEQRNLFTNPIMYRSSNLIQPFLQQSNEILLPLSFALSTAVYLPIARCHADLLAKTRTTIVQTHGMFTVFALKNSMTSDRREFGSTFLLRPKRRFAMAEETFPERRRQYSP